MNLLEQAAAIIMGGGECPDAECPKVNGVTLDCPECRAQEIIKLVKDDLLSHFQGAGLTEEEIKAIKYCHLDADLQCTSHEADCELCKDRAIANAATQKALLFAEANQQAAIKAERERIIKIMKDWEQENGLRLTTFQSVWGNECEHDWFKTIKGASLQKE